MWKSLVIGFLTLCCPLAVQAAGHLDEFKSTEQPATVRCQNIPGPPGWPGEMGPTGDKGMKGSKGENAFSRFKPPIGAPCYCPEGPKGDKGMPGEPGKLGQVGIPGVPGSPGAKGSIGVPGVPGPPGLSVAPVLGQPPQTPGTLYVPVAFAGKMPRVVCHHLRRHAYVPVLPNKFVGWYEEGKSGYLTYGKWLYYSSRFTCPCSVHLPPGPTPSPEELKRLMKRK